MSGSAPPSRHESMPQLQAPSTAASPCSAALGSDEAADAHLMSASTFESRRPTEMLHGGRLANVLPADSTSTLRQAQAQGRRAQARASDLVPCKARDALRATAATRTMRTSHERCFVPHVPAPTSVRRGAAPWPTTFRWGASARGSSTMPAGVPPGRTRSLPRESAEHWASAARADLHERLPRSPADKRVCPSTKRPRQLQALVRRPRDDAKRPVCRRSASSVKSPCPAEALHRGRLANVFLADPTSLLRQTQAQGRRASGTKPQPRNVRGT